MANEFAIDYQTGSTFYACIFQPNGNVFLTGGASDEVWGTGGRTAVDYDEPMAENAPDGHYTGGMPAGQGSGTYKVSFYLQAGGSPANSDQALFTGEIRWNGTEEIGNFDPVNDTVARVTLVDTTTDVTTKTGYKLASDGLDSISTTEPSGLASNFREQIVQLYRRFFGKTTMSKTKILTYKEDETTVATTQTISETNALLTQGEASSP